MATDTGQTYVVTTRAGKRYPTNFVKIGGVPRSELLTVLKKRRQVASFAENTLRVSRGQGASLSLQVALQVELTPVDFGFTAPPTLKMLLDENRLTAWSNDCLDGFAVGLNTSDVAPCMVIQDNSARGWHKTPVLIATQIILDSRKRPRLFDVGRYGADDRLWLFAREVSPDEIVPLDCRFSFHLRKLS